MPIIRRTKISLEDLALVGYDKLNDGNTDKIVHFFLDDYKFETVWKDPELHIERLRQYRAFLSPQYSLYTEMPLVLQAYNIFRNRWCGAFFQSKGIKVIPSMVWGTPESYWFCFDGISKGSIVAVSTIGMRTEKDLFLQGYREMQKRIDPSNIICYGEPFEEMSKEVIRVDYAETNNLRKWYKTTGFPVREVFTKSERLSVVKGGGAAGGGGGTLLPIKGRPNSKQSLYKNGELVQERFYDGEGKASRDIDYTDHGNPATHPEVPHEHTWDWSSGTAIRSK